MDYNLIFYNNLINLECEKMNKGLKDLIDYRNRGIVSDEDNTNTRRINIVYNSLKNILYLLPSPLRSCVGFDKTIDRINASVNWQLVQEYIGSAKENEYNLYDINLLNSYNSIDKAFTRYLYTSNKRYRYIGKCKCCDADIVLNKKYYLKLLNMRNKNKKFKMPRRCGECIKNSKHNKNKKPRYLNMNND